MNAPGPSLIPNRTRPCTLQGLSLRSFWVCREAGTLPFWGPFRNHPLTESERLWKQGGPLGLSGEATCKKCSRKQGKETPPCRRRSRLAAHAGGDASRSRQYDGRSGRGDFHRWNWPRPPGGACAGTLSLGEAIPYLTDLARSGHSTLVALLDVVVGAECCAAEARASGGRDRQPNAPQPG